MATRPVTVRILHQEAGSAAGPLERWVSNARARLAERHRVCFTEAGAADVAIVGGPPDDTPFGARLRAIVRADRPAGLVILGSGAIPLATERDYRELVGAATADGREALANNRFSADVVAIACAEALADLPDLPGDNALPRWLAEVAGYAVKDLRRTWRLGFDIDGPLELVMLDRRTAPSAIDVSPAGVARASASVDLARIRGRLAEVRSIAGDARAELVVSGRASAATVSWLERGARARVRAIVEERGLRAASRLALGPDSRVKERSANPSRPPSSVLGAMLERDGHGALGAVLARLGDAAIVDSRVLLAHRFGADETAWPALEDRFASDLLLPDRVRDPWLRELTAAAVEAPIPILLGGHSLVGPGLRLLLGRGPIRAMPWM